MKVFMISKMVRFVLVGVFAWVIPGFASGANLYGASMRRFNLTKLNGTNGFTINGIKPNDNSGSSVSEVGDINGDGIDDIIIGTDSNSGISECYVIFGTKAPWTAKFNLEKLDGTNGFTIDTGHQNRVNGLFVTGAGDVNGDGIDDFLIGDSSANDNFSGQSYVIFGSKEPWPVNFDLKTLDGNNGFIINGINPGDRSGYPVSGLGDVNGDGIDDIIIGTDSSEISESYVIFGKKKPWPAVINLIDLNGENGFSINGIVPDGYQGSYIDAGDVNSDGINDILIGLPGGKNSASFVLFGSKESWPAGINLTNLNGNNGFTIDQGGPVIRGAGDVNGDNIDDILIGSPFTRKGQSYIVFGKKKFWPARFNLTNLNGENGFSIINNVSRDGISGRAVSKAGDVNGDGVDDFLIGAPWANLERGQSYVIFGHKRSWPSTIYLSDLDGDNGFIIDGIDPDDHSGSELSPAGDLNNDGIDDFLVSAPLAKNRTGQIYVIFGTNSTIDKH